MTTVRTFWIIAGLVLFTVLLGHTPLFRALLGPLNTFETAVHELSHALACIFTGGSVTGMTIVADGQGHGGLTFCRGGIPFIYSQAGYIGETLFGCALILLSRYPRLSRGLLVFLGVCIGLTSLLIMPGTIFAQGRWAEGLSSIVWGLVLAGGFIGAGIKLKESFAHFLLLFIAVECALSSLEGVWVLLLQSFGLLGGWSDATNMARLTGLPSFFWGLLWAGFSVLAVAFTMWLTYKLDRQKL